VYPESGRAEKAVTSECEIANEEHIAVRSHLLLKLLQAPIKRVIAAATKAEVCHRR
jgi:hypothetical protein